MLPHLNWEVIRCSEVYTNFVITDAFRTTSKIHGFDVVRPPTTFDELKICVDAVRSRICETSDEVDRFVKALDGSPERDNLVKLLPYDGESLVLALPGPDTFSAQAWSRYLHPPWYN